jgi:hypothetical protein
MKKILHFFSVEDYRRDMSKDEKFNRDGKIAILLLVALVIVVLNMLVPLHAESIPKSKRFQVKDEWICPNRVCQYDNYDGIRYCGLCGTERGSRRR